ncbi:Ig-like domain-containing protein, partial [bacterium]|nr:Ig-like domain-containing protein [bacterium]
NDIDADGDTLTVAITTPASNGLLSLNGDGSFSYTPDVDFNGLDSFVYTAYDVNDSSMATVTIQVSSINDPPIALDDLYELQADSIFIVSSPGVLANDSDPDMGGFAGILSQGPTNGALTLNPDGSFNYTPDPGFTGSDSFLYFAEDDSGAASSPALVTLEVSQPTEPTIVTLEPTDDVHVKSTNPDKNYRARPYLIVEKDAFTAYLKFDVQGTGTIQTATLRLYVTGNSVEGGEIFSVSNNFEGSTTPWDEESLTASNAPVISGPSLASIGQAALGTYLEIDITQAVSGAGLFSFAIWKDTPDKVEYSSKEGGQPPQLVVVFGEGQANNPPVAIDDSYAASEDSILVVPAPGVLSNDIDADGDTLTVAI